MSKIILNRHFLTQISLDRRRRLHFKFYLLIVVVFTCLFCISILWTSSNTPVKDLYHSGLIGTERSGPYLSRFPRPRNRSLQVESTPLAACDVYVGSWVHEPSALLYNSSTCAFVELAFSCKENGRPDSEYLNWRWQPRGCNLPLFDAHDMLQRLKGMRLAFVGDSMGRTQWESLVCMLMANISDTKSVYELNGNNITKLQPYLAVVFSSFNVTIEYYRSPFLVQEGPPPKHVPKRVHSTLKLDKLEPAAMKWLHADILVFNTGHWWTHSKTFARGCYFQVDKSIRLGMSIQSAYRMALDTWASWVEMNLNSSKASVFFRSYEPSHWEGSWHNHQCSWGNSTYVEEFPYLAMLQEVVKNMTVPVTVLNITSMSSYRRDSHVGNWTAGHIEVDCCHWCLPGLPDVWNNLFYATLLQWGDGKWAL